MVNELETTKQQLQGILKELGLDITIQDTRALEQFYAIGQMDSQPRKRSVQTFDLKTTSNKATVIPLNDIHLGSLSANRTKFEAYIDYILQTPNTYTTILGDVIENATKESVGLGMFEEDIHIEDQVDAAFNLLKPLAAAGKIIEIHTGNHENRTSLLVQLNPMKIVADKLTSYAQTIDSNLPAIPYVGWQSFNLWTVGEQRYKVHTHHGAGGASTPAGRLNQLLKLRNISRSDLYLMAHAHDVLDYQTTIFDIDEESLEVKEIVQKYAICGSLLGYHHAYPEMKMLTPATQELIKIDFYKDRKDVKIYK